MFSQRIAELRDPKIGRLFETHVFALDPVGTPTVEALNLALKRRWRKS